MIRLSLVISTYNRADRLLVALQSLVHQSADAFGNVAHGLHAFVGVFFHIPAHPGRHIVFCRHGYGSAHNGAGCHADGKG